MLGSLISAGASLLGGLFQKKAQDKEADRQREFAQSGIQWKVEDAKKAGIHPLYALGAQTTSYAPQSVGDSGISAAGQDISRAIDATRTSSQRVSAISKTVQDLQVTRLGLENELLAAQIAKVRQAGGNPPMSGDPYLVDGQTQSGVVDVQGSKQVSTAPGAPYAQAGAVSDVAYARNATGGYTPVPSQDIKQLIEDQEISEVEWAIRNQVLPAFGKNWAPPPNVPLRPYERWRYYPAYGYHRIPNENYRSRGQRRWYE